MGSLAESGNLRHFVLEIPTNKVFANFEYVKLDVLPATKLFDTLRQTTFTPTSTIYLIAAPAVFY
jgi:hypothetical protein